MSVVLILFLPLQKKLSQKIIFYILISLSKIERFHLKFIQ